MLLVKHYIGISPIHGTGVFASEFIPKGTITWRLEDRFDKIVKPEDMNGLPLSARQFLEMYALYCEDVQGYVLCSDHAKHMNHSLQANTRAHDDYDIAVRDIQVGEEITCNYFDFDPESAAKLSPGA